MAGPWLKMECATPDKPEVLAITAALGWDDPDLTVGKLFKLWRWFDQQTVDGNAARVTPALLDRVVGVTGFVQAVADEGWLTIASDGISLSNFDRHNGETAKQRALTAKRVAEHKANAKANAEGNDDSVTESVPRGREEKEKNSPSLRSGEDAKRASRKCPKSFAITPELEQWAAENAPGVDLKRETEKFRDHTFKTAYSDWDGTWRNWIRRASESMPRARASPPASETAYQRSMRERVASICPSIAAKPPNHSETFDVTTKTLDRADIREADADLRSGVPLSLGRS